MKREDELKKDLLRDYIGTESFDKAPAGFTERVMETIRLQPVAGVSKRRNHNRFSVPVIFSMVTTGLILAALFLPVGTSKVLLLPGFLEKIKLPSLEISFDALPSLNLPGWVPFIFISMLILLVFDKALQDLLHREK
jgi:hypothetical protein